MQRHLVERFLSWRETHIPDKVFVFMVASVVGLLSGTGAFVLKRLVAMISRLLTAHLHSGSYNWLLLLLPLAGILLTGILCRYILHADLSNGTKHLLRDLKNQTYGFKPQETYSSILASSITLGFGGSAGSEGPIAYTGAAIGSNLARVFRMSPDMMMIMMGCGAGAGIAGIFKSPIGGALFTIEVLRMPLTTFSVLVLLVTAIIAAMTAFALSGFTPDIPFDGGATFDAGLLPYVILLGVACGLYSLYYSYIMKKVGRMLDHLRNPWVKNLIAGAVLSGLVFLFPMLYGEGYATVGKIINGNYSTLLNDSLFAGDSGVWMLIIVVAGTVLAKCFATSVTNNGGGVSGNFAPTLFAGCLFGFVFAAGLNEFFGLQLPVAHFAFYAMAGVMAGAIRAPLMAMFLTCEMGSAYAYFLPLMLTAAVSFGVVRLFTFDGYYTHHIDRNNGIISRILHKL